jgi:hypothetical protein
VLDEMISLAELLGHGIDSVRVDPYTIGERIIAGELTVYPEGGAAPFDPPPSTNNSAPSRNYQPTARPRPQLKRRHPHPPRRARVAQEAGERLRVGLPLKPGLGGDVA